MSIKKDKKQIYEGKAKILYKGPKKGTLIQYFKDDATAFNNKKKDVIFGKGVLNNLISENIMSKLNEIGIPTHFIKTLNMREQLVKDLEIIPIEVIVRNYIAGSLKQRSLLKEGTKLSKPIIEFCYKNDKLDDPIINEDHINAFDLATEDEIIDIKQYALRINDFLSGLFAAIGIKLVDFKIEFGRFFEDEYHIVMLADEISPDSCRLWDAKTNKKFDKDIFRQDLGNLTDAYMELAKRLGIFQDKQKLKEFKINIENDQN